MAPIENETQARQGEKGKPVLYVLVAALILAVVAGAGVLTWQGDKSSADRSSESTDAARGTATGSSSAPADKAR